VLPKAGWTRASGLLEEYGIPPNDSVSFEDTTRSKLQERFAGFKARASTAVTISALVGFQETQIFFSITLQIVCLITFRKSGLLMSPSVTELVTNGFLVKIIGATGVLPIVLNLCTIRRNQTTIDWFILIPSHCCVSIDVTNWSLANMLTFEPEQLSLSGLGPPACGRVNLIQYCFGDLASIDIFSKWLDRWSLSPYNKVFLSEPVMIVPLVVLIGFATTKFKIFRIKEFVRGDVFEWAVSKLSRDDQGRVQQHHVQSILHGFVAVVACWLLISSIALLIAVSLLMVPVSARRDSWCLGQIIAVAIWVPVLINWLHPLYRMLCPLSRSGYKKLT
jgi:hypothetical protein